MDRIIKSNNRDIRIDCAKMIATLLVVIGHSGFFDVDTNIIGLGLQMSNVIIDVSIVKKIFDVLVGVIYSCHMELFMVLSGMVYFICEYQHKYDDIRLFIENKFRRLILIYILITTCFNIPLALFAGYFGSKDILRHIVYYFIGFGKNHLWFLIALFIIQIVVKAIYNNNVLFRFTFTISIVLNIVVCKVTVIEFFYIDRVARYLFWFMLGIIIQRNIGLLEKVNVFEKKVLIFVMLVGWAGTYFVKIKFINNFISVFLTALAGVAFFVLVSDFISEHCPKVISNRIVSVISKNSFDIYIYGTPVNYIIFAMISVKYSCISPLVLNGIQSALFILLRVCLQITIPISMSAALHRIRRICVAFSDK